MNKPRILAIEDDEAIRRLIEVTLTARGYEIHTAHDGIAGLAAAETLRPDVIVLDVTMPRMDGWQVLAKLRETPEFAFTPVLLLTALGSPDNRVEGFRLGADDYISKPFRAAELELRVARALRQRAQLVYFSSGLSRARALGSATTIGGSLKEFSVTSVLALLYDEHKTGTLTLASATDRARVVFSDGLIVSVEANGRIGHGAAVAPTLSVLVEGTFAFEAATSVEGAGDPATAEVIRSMRSPLEPGATDNLPSGR